jgi:hypothetical protein
MTKVFYPKKLPHLFTFTSFAAPLPFTKHKLSSQSYIFIHELKVAYLNQYMAKLVSNFTTILILEGKKKNKMRNAFVYGQGHAKYSIAFSR